MLMLLRNLKVRNRLFVSFAIVILLLCSAAGFALFQAHRIESHLLDIKQNWMESIKTIADLRLALSTDRRATLGLVLSDSKQAKDTNAAIRAQALEQLRKGVNLYEKNALPGEDRQYFENDKKAIGEYAVINKELYTLAMSDNPDFATERALANSKIFTVFKSTENTLTAHMDFIQKQADQAAEKAIHDYDMALMLTFAVICIAIIATIYVCNTVATSIVFPLNDAVRIAEAVASGDLTSQVRVHSDTELGQLMRALRSMNESLVDIVKQVRSGSEAVLTGASEIAAGNENLSQRTEEQAASLEQTVASIQQLTATVENNAANARQGLKLAQTTSDLANGGGEVMKVVVTTMTGIADQSRKVADIIATIEGIAFQTNILALNAAVEAARAGNEGRGFAVVAQEVRTLAQRSASAAKEIKELVSNSVTRVDQGSQLVNDAGSKINEVVSEFAHVSTLMEEITHASDDGHRGIMEINKAIGEIDTVTQHNAALVEEAAAAARGVHAEAERLQTLVTNFKIARAI
ncbi:methyl-accepting chemotaxis protein [Paraburkholderia atlantica]|uniref:methyl-accepting chemotaxis protein n=1 Tax=Paraburkholderia atlantica TaxID=2654982 RepID=UPI003D21DDA1